MASELRGAGWRGPSCYHVVEAGVSSFTNSAWAGVFGIVLLYMFNLHQGGLGGKTGLVFTVLGVVAAWTICGCVPEMKGRTAVGVDEMIRAWLHARVFEVWAGMVGRGRPDSASTLVS